MKYKTIYTLLVPVVATMLFSVCCKAQADTVHWRESRPLIWADFKGDVDTSINGDALTAATISYETFYKGDSIKIKVLCYFNQMRSWTKHMDDTLLKHEQGHFDITEIFARRLRKELAELPQGEISKQKLDKVFTKMMDEKRKLQNLYDSETNSSQNRAEQFRWNVFIHQELHKFDAFRQ